MIISNGSALNFAPQALGEIVPNVANGYFYSAGGLDLLGMHATYGHLYKAQPSISTVVDKIANAAARLTVKLWDTSPETGKVQDKTSPMARLLANPSKEMSPFNFWRWTFSTYEIYGESFWYKQRADQSNPNSPVVNLLPMHPSRTAVHRDPKGNVEYIFTLGVASAGILYAPERDVVAFLRYNPESLMRGLSRLEPLRATLFNEDAARRANQSWWAKAGRPSLAIRHPGELSQGAQDRLKASFDARHAGADNMGGTMVLEEGMEAQILQLNAEEMQYIESRKLNLQEVCMVFDVPPPVIHILDHATYSNITEQMRSMYRDTMAPRLEDAESVIDFSLLSEFDLSTTHETEFDMSEVLRGDFEGRATAVVGLRNAGLATGNQGLEIMGFPRSEDPEMDKFYANAALVPLGTPAQRVSITEAATPSPAQSAEASGAAAAATSDPNDATKAVTVRAVLGKLGRVKGTKPEIRKALVAAHQKALTAFFDRQRKAVKAASSSKASGVFDPTQWDGDLASILHTLSKATAQAIGAKVAADMGGKYSSDDIAAWMESNSATTAKSINQATADEIVAAFERAADDESPDDTIDGIFDGEIAARADQISLTRVLVVGGLAALVAARLSNARTKTWITGGKPRSSHASMSGETVPLNTLFSNGMNGPGDYSGGADEVAGCNCTLSFSVEGSELSGGLGAQDYYAQQ
jgi:HK97 family phage portal protein